MTRAIIAGIAFVCAGAIFFMFTKGTYDAMAPVKADIARYDEALAKVREVQQLEQSLLAKYNAFDPVAVERLKKLLPDHVDNVRLILDFDHLAAQHGLALQNVVVSAPTLADESQEPTDVGAAARKYDSITMSFSTVSTYSEFTKFLLDLEQSLRIVDLVSLRLIPGGTPVRGEPVYNIDITIRTYWLK